MAVGGGAAFQLYGYRIYCLQGAGRPWCSAALPNIYSFVQSHYWYARPLPLSASPC